MQPKYYIEYDILYLSVPAIAEAMANGRDNAIYDRAFDVIKHALRDNREGKYDSWHHINDSDDARRVWVRYDTIAKATKEKIDNYYGDVWLAAHKEDLVRTALQNIEIGDSAYYMAFGHYSPHQIEGMVEGCGWLRLLSTPGWYFNMGMHIGKTQAMEIAAKIIKERNLYGLKCGNPLSLYRKLKEWDVAGRDSLLSGKIGNDSAVKGKVCRQTMIDRIIDLYAHPTKPNITKVWEIYSQEARERGWEQLTRQRIEQILNEPINRQQWFAARNGKNKAREAMENTIKRAALEYADQIWSWDGTTVQIWMDEDGKLSKPMYRVTIADGYSRAIIAEAYGETETADVALECLRLAVGFAGYVPTVIQYDKGIGKMKRVQGALAKMKVLGINSQPYNGKSKYVESIQGFKEQKVMRFYGNFTGGNITSPSLGSKSNPDHIKLLHKQGGLPTTRRGVIFQDLLATVIYNNTIVKKYGKTPLERYNEPDSRRKKADIIQVAYALWYEAARLIEYSAKGLTLNFGESRFDYVVEEDTGLESQDFRSKWLGARFKVRFHPDDMNKIALYTEEDKFVAFANSKYEYKVLPTLGEMGKLKKAWEQRSQFVEKGLKGQKERRERLQEQGIPELSFELAHKDALNRAGLAEEALWINATTLTESNEEIPTRSQKAIEDSNDDSIYDVDMDWVRQFM